MTLPASGWQVSRMWPQQWRRDLAEGRYVIGEDGRPVPA